MAAFKNRGFEVLGIEPSSALANMARGRGIDTRQSLFSSQLMGDLRDSFLPVGIYLSFYTFDHLPAPMEFLRVVSDTLDKKNGLVLIEVHDLDEIIERKEACLFCHEHTIYPSAASLAEMLRRAGLQPLSIELLDANVRRGNSLLMVAARPESVYSPDKSIQDIYEPSASLEKIRDFSTEIDTTFFKLGQAVRAWKNKGLTVAGYGASARSISSLALADLSHKDIEYVCDANESLHGYVLPKSHVPVRAPSYAMDCPVDVMIVFAYGYIEEIKEIMRPRTDQGMKLISLLTLLKNQSEYGLA